MAMHIKPRIMVSHVVKKCSTQFSAIIVERFEIAEITSDFAVKEQKPRRGKPQQNTASGGKNASKEGPIK